MIKSMTGYGKAIFEINKKKIIIEIKSLNSKQIDINTRIPSLYREKEITIRREISEKLQRGKIDLTVYIEDHGEEPNSKINESVLISYFNQIRNVNDALNLSTDHTTLQAVLKLPDVIKPEFKTVDEEEWQIIMKNLREALHEIDTFRIKEGEVLKADIAHNTKRIKELLLQTEPYEEQRINTVKKRLTDSLNNIKVNGNIDESRFEQELIYYLDKINMNEEKVRLKNHCSHFMETLEQASPNGKKLNFISQEMGREINTLGAKAYDSEIQRLVVRMKDHLERIKEQLLNVL
jgi:uncharacterized protein (TIGR00255 family)